MATDSQLLNDLMSDNDNGTMSIVDDESFAGGFCYIDFIHSPQQIAPVIEKVAENLRLNRESVTIVSAPNHISGPSKRDAEHIFASTPVADNEFDVPSPRRHTAGRLCSPAYIEASHAIVPLVAPVPIGSSASNVPTYSSVVVVSSSSPFHTLQDLYQSTFAFNDERSLSGFQCM